MSSRFTDPPPSLAELLDTFGLLPPEKASRTSSVHTSPAPASAGGQEKVPSAVNQPDAPGDAVRVARFFTDPGVFSNWLVQLVVRDAATDIYLSPAGIRLRRADRLAFPSQAVDWDATAAETLLGWLTGRFLPTSVLAERFRARLRDTGAAVTSWTTGGHRFQVNVFHAGEQLSFIFRHIPPGIRHFSHLALPPALFTWLLESIHEGLFLLSGPAGSGKSATLSSCIGFWNDNCPHHIVVIEDPVEYFYESRMALIHQLEVGTDSSSISDALHNALRQSPQILVIGEIRDGETARLALQAAESGHLVAATIDAPHTFGALQRFTGFFPEREQSSVWQRLVRVFSAVVGQRLLPAKDRSPLPASASGKVRAHRNHPGDSLSGEALVDGGRLQENDTRPSRIPAVEVLRRSPSIAHLLASPHCTRELVLEAMERSRNEYMITMDDYLYLLLVTGRIDAEVAFSTAHSPSDMKLRMAARGKTPP